MKARITFRNIPSWKQEYIQKDFQHFFAEMKFQMMLMLEKIEKNKGIQARVINRLKKTKMMGLNAQVMNIEILMQGLAGADVGNTSFEKGKNKFIVNFEMEEFYFEMIDAIKSSGQGFWGFGLVDKKQLIKDFQKAFRKNITHNFTLEMIE